MAEQSEKEYNVLEDVEIEGEDYSKGAVVSLTDEVAAPFVTEGKLEVSKGDEDAE